MALCRWHWEWSALTSSSPIPVAEKEKSRARGSLCARAAGSTALTGASRTAAPVPGTTALQWFLHVSNTNPLSLTPCHVEGLNYDKGRGICWVTEVLGARLFLSRRGPCYNCHKRCTVSCCVVILAVCHQRWCAGSNLPPVQGKPRGATPRCQIGAVNCTEGRGWCENMKG